jgi:hypothetical protein
VLALRGSFIAKASSFFDASKVENSATFAADTGGAGA